MYLFSPASLITADCATRLYGFSDSGSEPGLVTSVHFGWNFMANSTAMSSLPAFRKVNKLVNGTKQYNAQLLYKMFNLGLCETWYIVLVFAKISSLREQDSIRKKSMLDMLWTKLNFDNLSLSTSFSSRRLPIYHCSIFTSIYLPSTSRSTYWPSLNKLQEINPLETKCRLLYLKTQFVPRSKHFPSQL